MLSLLLKYNWNKTGRYFQTRRIAKIIIICLFASLFALMSIGIYLFFREGFYFIGSDPYFREAFSFYVYEMYLLVFVCLVVFSTFITGIFSLFRKHEDDWILSSPGFRVFPQQVFFRLVLTSLWPFLIIVFPALLAIRKVFGLGLSGLFLVSMNAVVLDVLVVLIVILSMLLVGKTMLMISRRIFKFEFSFKKFIFVFIVLALISLFAVWQKSLNHDLVKLFGAADVNAVEASVELIGENFKYLPSHIVAASIYSWQSGNMAFVLINFLSLFSLVIFLAIFWWQSSSWFLDLWQVLQEGKVFFGKKKGKQPNKTFNFFLRNQRPYC